MERHQLELSPITLQAAKAFIREFHRHHVPPVGWKFGVAVRNGGQVVGVATVGRPSARMLDDGWTAEVTRCCTDRTPHVCSMLYGACRRAAKALGYRRLYTYILLSEPGTSLRAAGWEFDGLTDGGSWDRPSRQRTDKHPTQPKQRWKAAL